MIRTKSTRTLTPAGLVAAGKIGYSHHSLLPVLALYMATAAWSQTAPAFRGGRVLPDVLRGGQQPIPAPATPANAQYQFISIEVPGATGGGPGLPGAFAYGIDNAGVVTGLYTSATASNGLVWRNGTLHTLDNPSSQYTALSSVSNLGVAAGYYGDLTTVHAATYSFQSGMWTTLPDISGMPNNEAYGINKSGVVAGVAGGGNFNAPTTVASWIWDPSSQSYSFFNVPGAEQYSTYDDAINDRGQVVGSYDDSSGVEHGFLKDGETYTTIDVPGAMYTVAYGINNRGAIVGYWGNLSGWSEGFVRTSDGTVTVVDFPGALETQIGNINDHGDICGLWVDPKTGVWTPFVGFKK